MALFVSFLVLRTSSLLPQAAGNPTGSDISLIPPASQASRFRQKVLSFPFRYPYSTAVLVSLSASRAPIGGGLSSVLLAKELFFRVSTVPVPPQSFPPPSQLISLPFLRSLRYGASPALCLRIDLIRTTVVPYKAYYSPPSDVVSFFSGRRFFL